MELPRPAPPRTTDAKPDPDWSPPILGAIVPKRNTMERRATPNAKRPCAAGERCAVCGLSPLIEAGRHHSRVVAESPIMRALLRRASRFAVSDAPVMLLGESGTGKEVVARALHASSRRHDKPFVAINVAALPAELLESELFGHVRGAFTGAAVEKQGLFEAADGGTLFLDEIAEMPLILQAKLLRALQDGEVRKVGDTRAFAVDARIVCATHRDLAASVQREQFREDLYFRLKVLTLKIPPLRDRREDILPLATRFLADEGAPQARFSPAAERLLSAYGWPGNVRELANAVKHGLALAESDTIGVEDLPEELVAPVNPVPAPKADLHDGEQAPQTPRNLRPLAEVERDHVMHVLEACGGSQVEAARVLGIGRNTLWRKLRAQD
jgi:two-component system response regulator HydG